MKAKTLSHVLLECAETAMEARVKGAEAMAQRIGAMLETMLEMTKSLILSGYYTEDEMALLVATSDKINDMFKRDLDRDQN